MSYKTVEDYGRFTKPAELHKAINTLKGIVCGITSDCGVNTDEIEELLHWCRLHEFLIEKHPFDELIPLIDRAMADGNITNEELQDILWLCTNILNDGGYYNVITSGLQQLQGLLHGLLADNYLSDKEIYLLNRWLSENDFLRGCYPFDEIESLLTAVLLDCKVTSEEREKLCAYFSMFIDLASSKNLNATEFEKKKNELNICGICAVDPQIEFENNIFCFTGKSYKSSRDKIANQIVELGGIYNDNVTNKTKYLIIGNGGNPCWAFACYGRKVEQAIGMRKNGNTILLVHENDFWDCILKN